MKKLFVDNRENQVIDVKNNIEKKLNNKNRK